MLTMHSGLDNAGKTTIVKKIMNEDVNSVSPTLGFIIKTIDYDGWAPICVHKLVLAMLMKAQLQTQHLWALSCNTPATADNWPPIGDVGGQKTLRTYWKNYFEKTDTLIWVVDSTDRERLADCRQELDGLLVQEVCYVARKDIIAATNTS
jgi:ADP-ribosylation factor-like protein 2